jgi:hypothetical protein
MRRDSRIVAADGRRPLPASTLIRLGSAAQVCRSSPSGKVRSYVLVRPYVRCHRVTVRSSSGARGDRSAERTYVARGINSAHSEVVRGMP